MIIIKHPNGYGSIYKLSGKRRKPFAVRVTTGWDKEGKQIRKVIGYYTTKQEAMIALADFNKNPYSLESTVTFKELYEKYSFEKFPKISKSNVNGYIAAFNTSEMLHNIKFAEIRKAHMQAVIDNCGKGYGTLRKIKVLYNQLFKFALENDIVDKDYSEFVDIGKNPNDTDRTVFSQEEINSLWENVNRMEYVDCILILIYTGLRISELLEIENKNVFLDKNYMIGGNKTDAGKDRVIPINKKIFKFIEARYNQGGEFLILNSLGRRMKYENFYQEKWKRIMDELNMSHRIHDTRHTFVSLMDSAGVNKVALKRIIGHSSSDITEKVYTHKDINELYENINLI